MVNIEELGPLEQQLVRLYAKRYGLDEASFLAELDKVPGDTLSDKLKAYAQSRRGISATGNLLTVFKERPYPQEDGSVRYRVAVMTYLPDSEKERLAKELNYPDINNVTIFTLWVGDKKLVDRLHNAPIGSKVTVTGIKVTQGDRGGVFLNARNVIPGDVDYEFLESSAATVEDIKQMAIDEGRSMIIRLQGYDIVPDPVETTTSKGQPKLRIYVGEDLQLDFVGSAVTKLKQYGDPYKAEFWAQMKDKPIYVRAIYQRDVGGMAYFTCVGRSDVVVGK